jgi:DNA-binding MarR family transcriptional regulator
VHLQNCHRARRIAGNGGTERAGNGGELARLQRDGLVIREDDPDDRRAKQIRLTTTGRQAADLTRAALTRLERRWRSIVGEDWPQLRASLADIAFHSLPPAD